ncbi:MAG: hypothetical protein Ct9H300mP9_2590 [Candidatus Neomarinimicrobiota bacterium]|nr:MAG: hypothetical protein Ct9H300mP9_2590 [Candidatus Neomarinimicrobiota bacterium]
MILFSIAYGSAMGSIGTPSGGGRNVIMIGYWQEFGFGDISYLGWMRYTYSMLLIEIPFAVANPLVHIFGLHKRYWILQFEN